MGVEITITVSLEKGDSCTEMHFAIILTILVLLGYLISMRVSFFLQQNVNCSAESMGR